MTSRTNAPPSLVLELLDALPLGVVLLDRDGRVRLYNRFEEQLACRSRENVLGRLFFEEVAPCMKVKALAGTFEANIGKRPLDASVDVSIPFPFLTQPREVRVRLSSFSADGEPFGLVYIEDVSTRVAVDRMRQRLSELLIHDMKSPLAAVVGNVSFLEERINGDADLSEVFNDVKSATDRLERMMHTLLDYAGLQSGALQVARKATDLTALATASALGMRVAARAAEVELTVIATAPCIIDIDGQIVRRALDNLVDNALRYAPSSSTVTIRVVSTDSNVSLEVQDEGPGVAPDARDGIFQPYFRLDAERRQENRGLGLCFVQLAMGAHGGSATVDDGPTGGAVFRLTFPRTFPDCQVPAE